MGQIFKPCERDQLFLLPPNMREWLPEGHLAYFIVDLVEQMDLSEIYSTTRKTKMGRSRRRRDSRPMTRG
jgi:hypothetical protein